jgi:hypothetical protein
MTIKPATIALSFVYLLAAVVVLADVTIWRPL